MLHHGLSLLRVNGFKSRTLITTISIATIGRSPHHCELVAVFLDSNLITPGTSCVSVQLAMSCCATSSESLDLSVSVSSLAKWAERQGGLFLRWMRRQGGLPRFQAGKNESEAGIITGE